MLSFKKRRGHQKNRPVPGTDTSKNLYKKPDRALIEEFHLNNAYMHFCGLSCGEVADANREGKKIIDHLTLVKIRKRLGLKKIKAIPDAFTGELVDKKIIDGKYQNYKKSQINCQSLP